MYSEVREGDRFSRLLVLRAAGSTRSGRKFNCVCDCGVTKEVFGYQLKNRAVKSCGCLRAETARAAIANARSCRKSTNAYRDRKATPEYISFAHAKSRCENPKDISFPRYGGQGIQFKFSSFSDFLKAVGPRPQPSELYSLDRWPNPQGHYEAGNICWSTATEQAQNRRRRRWKVKPLEHAAAR
jgi:hypothetical protein